MSNLNPDWIASIVCTLIAIVATATWVLAHETVANECEKLGAFYIGDKVYECKLKGKPA